MNEELDLFKFLVEGLLLVSNKLCSLTCKLQYLSVNCFSWKRVCIQLAAGLGKIKGQLSVFFRQNYFFSLQDKTRYYFFGLLHYR